MADSEYKKVPIVENGQDQGKLWFKVLHQNFIILTSDLSSLHSGTSLGA